MSLMQPGTYLFYSLFFPIYLFSLLGMFPDCNFVSLFDSGHHDAGQIANVAYFFNAWVGLFDSTFGMGNYILQRHDNRKHECFHHVVIEVESFRRKVFQAAPEVLVLTTIHFQSLQHHFQIKHRPLRIQVVDLDIRQKQRVVCLWQLFCQNLSDSDS